MWTESLKGVEVVWWTESLKGVEALKRVTLYPDFKSLSIQ